MTSLFGQDLDPGVDVWDAIDALYKEQSVCFTCGILPLILDELSEESWYEQKLKWFQEQNPLAFEVGDIGYAHVLSFARNQHAALGSTKYQVLSHALALILIEEFEEEMEATS